MIISLLLSSMFSNFKIKTSFFFGIFILTSSNIPRGYAMNSSLWGGDLSSMSFLALTFWILGLSMVSSPQLGSSFSFILSSLGITLFLAFYSLNFLNFYIFFELSLIPSFALILKFGYQEERLESALYSLFYTMFGSLPLLGGFIFIWGNMKTLNFPTLTLSYFNPLNMNPSLFLTAFLSKLPLFGLHLWLPKAHVEAPVSGSMILAALLLKLGGFGILRISQIMTFSPLTTTFLSSSSIWGSILTALICLRQIDLKKMVAYSSVSHMGLILAASMTMSSWAPSGTLIASVAHGLTSSGLFFMVGSFYDRLHTRSILLLKGSLTLAPSLSFFLFIFFLLNSATPPSLNFWGELTILFSLLSWNINLMTPLSMILFLGIFYNISMFMSLNHGPSNKTLLAPSLLRETYLITAHLLPSFLLILQLNLSNFSY